MTARRRLRRDDGRVSIFLAIALLATIIVVGLAVDGGGQFRTLSRADNIAAEAARAAGQAIDVPAAVAGHEKVVDVDQAKVAAEAYLSDAGVTGRVEVADDRHSLTVTVAIPYDTVVLGLLGISQITVTGRATAELVTG